MKHAFLTTASVHRLRTSSHNLANIRMRTEAPAEKRASTRPSPSVTDTTQLALSFTSIYSAIKL